MDADHDPNLSLLDKLTPIWNDWPITVTFLAFMILIKWVVDAATNVLFPENKKNREIDSLKVVTSTFALLLGIFTFFFLIANDFEISPSISDWGATGDFIGGIMNPIISVAVLFLVLRTYQTQREELAQMTREFEKSAENQKQLAQLTAIQAEIAANTALFEASARAVESLQDDLQSAYKAPTNSKYLHPDTNETFLNRDDYIIYQTSVLNDLHDQTVESKNSLRESLKRLKCLR